MIKSISLILILANVIFFFVEPKTAGFRLDINHPLNELLEFTPATAFEMPWTFVTSIFMHADLSHLIFNMFALFIFGLFLESRVRPITFVTLYFLAGIVGNLGYMASTYIGIFPNLSPDIVGIGASGAIYGVMGVLGVIAPRASIYVMLLPIPVPMFVGVIIYAVIELLGFFAPGNIARGAHLGGLALGVLYGFWLRHQIKRHESRVRVRYVWE